MHFFIALPGLHEKVDPATQAAKNQPPKFGKNFTDGNDEKCGSGQVCAEGAEHLFERGDHENHDHCNDHKGNDHHRNGVHQSRLDLGLDGLGFLHVNRQTVEQLFQNTGSLTSLYQIAVQAVEIKRILAKGGAQRGTRFDIGPNVVQELGHAGVGIASPDNVKGLQKRYTSLHHRRQLACEDGNVFGLDALARSHAPLFDFTRHDTLAAQGGQHLVLTYRACLTANGLAIAVFAFPFENKVFDAFGCSGCHGVLGVVCLALHHSLVTLSTSSSEVIPCLTFSRPDSRSVRTPSLLACWAMSKAPPPRKMMRCISSEMGITW